MADPPQTLTFLSWVRERVSALATGRAGGRAQAEATITLSEKGADGTVSRTQARSVPFLLAGPADVVGLGRGAIARRYPSPGALDHESDSCPYIELADPSFPWRYTPDVTPAPTSPNLHPWLVLIVGKEGTELTLTGAQVTIETGAQGGEHTIGAPSAAYPFAHVQVDGAGHRTARVLCGRHLDPGTDYLAVVVPAFDESGAPSWTGAAPVTIPAYDSWRFRTAVPAGSFEDLAARLRPGDAPPTTGRAALHYPRLANAPELTAIGALVAVPPDGEPITEEPLATSVADDLADLQLPARDDKGRPIVALPRYGEAWEPGAREDSSWRISLNGDPRHRGVAGLGLEVGIQFQEELVADVLAHLGALHEARQRIRNAVMGVAASRSLWKRRVPTEATERLWLLGPSLSRLATDTASIGDQATADDRTLARGTFSAAARRVLRSGPARTTLAASPLSPTALLEAANRPPPTPPATIDGLPLDRDAIAEFDRARRRAIDAGQVRTATLLAAATDLVNGTDDRVRPLAGQMVSAMRQAAQAGRAVPWAQALTALAASDAAVVGRARNPQESVGTLTLELGNLRDGFSERADDADLTGLLAELSSMPSDDPTLSPVEIRALAAGVSAAFDPTTDVPPVAMRVLDTINGGVDPAQPLAPPEPCVGLDRPVWADVKRAFDEWLLPGAGQLAANSVISLQTNPVFTDAFLVGLNSQMLAELRWRNIPVATGCTPIRRFWDRADTASGARADDIIGIQSWATASPLGDAGHLAPGASGGELVIAARGELFLRYPTTLVYLRSAARGNPPVADFDRDPDDDADRILPGFQGRLATDIVFFGFPGFDAAAIADYWVVFEEPPAGYRFANDVATATSGHAWAKAALAQPVRVLIQGNALIAGGS
jgi:hypothetical protein